MTQQDSDRMNDRLRAFLTRDGNRAPRRMLVLQGPGEPVLVDPTSKERITGRDAVNDALRRAAGRVPLDDDEVAR